MAQDFLQHQRLSKLQEEMLEELEIMELQPKSWWRAPWVPFFLNPVILGGAIWSQGMNFMHFPSQ